MLIPNIIDFKSYLTVIKQQQSTKKITKNASMGKFNNNRTISKFQSNKTVNKQACTYYQIQNCKTFKLNINPNNTHVYDFGHIDEGSQERVKKIGKIMVKQTHSCKVLVCHNYESYQVYQLILQMGKSLIESGIFFNLVMQEENQQNSHNLKAKKQHANIVNKKISFMSDLKHAITYLQKQDIESGKVWIVSGSFWLAVYVVQNLGETVKMMDNVMQDYARLSIAMNDSGNNMNNSKFSPSIMMSTIIDSPCYKNLKKSQKVLDQSIAIRDYIQDYAKHGKRDFINFHPYSSQEQSDIQDHKFYPNQIHLEPQSLLSSIYNNQYPSTKINSKFNSHQLIKNSQTQPNLLCTKIGKQNNNDTHNIQKGKIKKPEKQRTKKRKNKAAQYSLSQQYSSSQSCISTGKEGKQKNIEYARILAQNMHLKWQMKSVQQDFRKQSEEYTKKMNSKIEAIKQDRSACLKQMSKLRKDNQDLLQQVSKIKSQYDIIICRLRKDNQDLLEQINKIKGQYQIIINTRGHYQNRVNKENLENQERIKRIHQQKIQELENNVVQYAANNQKLKVELQKMKQLLHSSRERSRQRLQQLLEENQSYKLMCEQMRQFCEGVQRDFRMQKNRSQNLQQRCKKYKQSMDDLWKINDTHQDKHPKSGKRIPTFNPTNDDDQYETECLQPKSPHQTNNYIREKRTTSAKTISRNEVGYKKQRKSNFGNKKQIRI